MSWTSDKLLGFDLESTSPLPSEARPVSFALIHFDFGTVAKARTGLINPGVPIPEDTTAIHGISDEMVQERGGDLQRSVEGIVGALVEADVAGIPVVGMNLRYDLTVIDRLFREFNGGEGLYDIGWEGNVIDALVLDRAMDKYRKGKRNLTALCAHYGVTLTDAHSAAADTIASVEVVLAIASKYPEIAEAHPTELHISQVAWHRDWAEHFSEYRVGKGDSPLSPDEMEWPLPGGPQSLSDPPEAESPTQTVSAPPASVQPVPRTYPPESDPELATFDPQMLHATRLMVASFKAEEVDRILAERHVTADGEIAFRRDVLVRVLARARHEGDESALAMF